MNLSFNMLNQAMLTQVLHELRLGNLQEHALWQRWCQIRTEDGTEDKLDAMMMLAEEQQISLTIVWQQIDQYSNKT